MSSVKSIIEHIAYSDYGTSSSLLDEGLGSIATSKLADLARGFIFRARPLIIVHRTRDNSTVTLKLKRGLINHILTRSEEGSADKQISKSPSAAVVLTQALNHARKLIQQGYIEI